MIFVATNNNYYYIIVTFTRLSFAQGKTPMVVAQPGEIQSRFVFIIIM